MRPAARGRGRARLEAVHPRAAHVRAERVAAYARPAYQDLLAREIRASKHGPYAHSPGLWYTTLHHSLGVQNVLSQCLTVTIGNAHSAWLEPAGTRALSHPLAIVHTPLAPLYDELPKCGQQ